MDQGTLEFVALGEGGLESAELGADGLGGGDEGLDVGDGEDEEVVLGELALGEGEVGLVPHRHHHVLCHVRARQAEPAGPRWPPLPPALLLPPEASLPASNAPPPSRNTPPRAGQRRPTPRSALLGARCRVVEELGPILAIPPLHVDVPQHLWAHHVIRLEEDGESGQTKGNH